MDIDPSHWQRLYGAKEPRRLSWYERSPTASLELIEEAGLSRDAAIVDAGGGASRLAGELLVAGYTDVTVVDVSEAALERARAELGPEAERVSWIRADLRGHRLGRRFDLWHDRAVLHFMVEDPDRARYLETLRGALRPGGHLVVATFGPEGPTRCSGLPVARYGADDLAALFGAEFELLSSRLLEHRTPAGTGQQFVYAHLRRSGAT